MSPEGGTDVSAPKGATSSPLIAPNPAFLADDVSARGIWCERGHLSRGRKSLHRQEGGHGRAGMRAGRSWGGMPSGISWCGIPTTVQIEETPQAWSAAL